MSRFVCADSLQRSRLPDCRAESVPSVAPRRGRFVSPSLLVLALLTLPFPWIEVRCGGNTFRQSGVEILLNRQTDIDRNTGATASRGREFTKPARVFLAWLWVLVSAAGVVLGYFARAFVPALLHLLFSCGSVGLFSTLLAKIQLEELLCSLRFSPVLGVTFLSCLVAACCSVVSFARRFGSRRLVDP
jgi:hypothetical protein